MFRPYRCEKDVARLENGRALDAGVAIAHLDAAVEDDEHLLAIVDMPLVRLIRPMQASILAMSTAPHARDAVKLLLRTIFMDIPVVSRRPARRSRGTMPDG
ncbi:cupin domain protein [Burkholderia pseudomallei]|nr:cupin domain protein [Burkholderia pseudomallei]